MTVSDVAKSCALFFMRKYSNGCSWQMGWLIMAVHAFSALLFAAYGNNTYLKT